MSDGTGNPHFMTVDSWAEAAAQVTFAPRPPSHTAGHRLASIRIHMMDHRRRALPAEERSVEAHYGTFVVTQQRAASAAEARRLALERSYGADSTATTVAGHEARAYELGPDPGPDDIDGRMPAVIAWADGDVFHLVASGELDVAQLAQIAQSIYS